MCNADMTDAVRMRVMDPEPPALGGVCPDREDEESREKSRVQEEVWELSRVLHAAACAASNMGGESFNLLNDVQELLTSGIVDALVRHHDTWS